LVYVKPYNCQLDVESVEEDNDNITEEETIIQTALSTLDQRSAILLLVKVGSLSQISDR
jgi:hypothetical protein